MCHSTLKGGVCDRHLFLGCSEIKSSKAYDPIINNEVLISDINKYLKGNIYNLFYIIYYMDNQRGLTIVLWVVVLFGIFFLARGLTGKAIQDISVSDNCQTDQDCSTGNVCCNSMCYTPEVCSQITSPSLEKPQKDNFLFDIGFGFFVLVAVLIAFYGVNRKNNKKLYRSSRKKTRKHKR